MWGRNSNEEEDGNADAERLAGVDAEHVGFTTPLEHQLVVSTGAARHEVVPQTEAALSQVLVPLSQESAKHDPWVLRQEAEEQRRAPLHTACA